MADSAVSTGPGEPGMAVLGVPRLFARGAPAFAPERRFQLLSVLAVRSGEWITRDELAALLWPERPNGDARRNLRHVVFKARELPGTQALEVTKHALRWNVGTDLRDFEQALGRGDRERALALPRSELLHGIDDPANPALAEWLTAQRAHFDACWQQAAHEALREDLAPQRMVELAQRLLDFDPLDEAAMAALLRAEVALGRVATAQRQYVDYAHRLAEELGVEPSQRLRDLLVRDAPTGGAAAVGPLTVEPSREAGAAFVGRRQELAALARLIGGGGARAVTLLGPGGVGKSSMARHALLTMADAFPGGRVWVELQDLTEMPAVVARLADVLGVPINDTQDTVEQIGRRLGLARVLTVLDNAEHLAAGLAAVIERVLGAAPGLCVIVTSRARLGHAGEQVLPLAGLAVPDEESRDLEAAVAFDAVRLFEARASAALRSFDLAPHLAAVIDILEAVGGLPLAIELAAGWVRLLPCKEIAQDLRRSMDLLERDPAADGVPARPEHACVRIVLEQAWNLLAPRERAALAALSVFKGGFTRAAALAVAQAPLPLLSSLVDKGLLAVDEAGRFSLHALVAAVAAERLAEEPARARACARRHAEHYAQFLADLGARAGVDHRPLLEGVDAEYANCRAAWAHGLALGRLPWLARSTAAWRNYFELRGRAGEGIAHFQPTLELGAQGPARQALAADVRSALSRLHYLRGEHSTGLAVARSGIESAAQCGNRRAMFRCLTNAGSCLSAMANWSAARSYFERALAIGRADGAAMEIASSLNNLGIVAKNEGRWAEALDHYGGALAIEREQGRHAGVARCLSVLGGLHLSQGAWQAARHCMEEGLRLSERFRVDFFVPVHACGLGEALLELGELDDASRHLRRALELACRADNPIIATNAQANLARIAMKRSDSAGALEHLRRAGSAAVERGWDNMCLHIAMLYGEWLRVSGQAGDAVRVWHMVVSHPQADAGMREQARRWGRALGAAFDAPQGSAGVTLVAVMDRLLAGSA